MDQFNIFGLSLLDMKKSKEYLVKHLGNTWVVWHEPTNHYFHFLEPAYRVFRFYISGLETSEAAKGISAKYKIPQEEALCFTTEIYENIRKTTEPAQSITNCHSIANDQVITSFEPWSEMDYHIADKTVKIIFSSEEAEYAVHPYFSHLACTVSKNADIVFEFAGSDEEMTLNCNGKKVFTGTDRQILFGSFFKYLMSSIYDIQEDRIMAVSHASAVTNGRTTVVFPGPPGSGKSTLTALMVAHGFPFIADDFVVIDALNFCAYPFPAALSVKNGSVGLLSGYFKDITSLEVFPQQSSSKQMRFLPLYDPEKFFSLKYPVNLLFFPSFDENVEFIVEKLPLIQAMKLFFEQTWVSTSRINVGRFLEWFGSLTCYSLRYSDNRKALDFIKDIMNESS